MEPIIIARYSFPHEAHIARASLQSAGIPAYVSDAHIIGANWFYSNFMGGVKLWVHPQDAPEAMQLLATDYSESLEAELASSTQPDFSDSLGVDPYAKPNAHSQRAGFAFLLFLALFLYI